jgi:four helix bundle protein
MDSKGIESLGAWQLAREPVTYSYGEVLPKLPVEEKWGLISQIRRATVSVPANITEGYGRYYFQETIKHYYFARGSLDELLSHVVVCFDLGYLSEEDFKLVRGKISELRRVLNGFIRFLNKRKLSGTASSMYQMQDDSYINLEDLESEIRDKDYVSTVGKDMDDQNTN